MLQLDAIYKAAHVLKEVVRRTDLIYAPQINPESTVYLKPENLQLTGSFKVRGAYYKISQLSDEEKARGVIACSAGNHAQGVALAATKCGIKSLICLPKERLYLKLRLRSIMGRKFVWFRESMMMLIRKPCNCVMKRDILLFIPLMTRT